MIRGRKNKEKALLYNNWMNDNELGEVYTCMHNWGWTEACAPTVLKGVPAAGRTQSWQSGTLPLDH